MSSSVTMYGVVARKFVNKFENFAMRKFSEQMRSSLIVLF